MNYRIVQDIPGRLRLRCGQGALDTDEAHGITEQLRAIPKTVYVKVASANGSILVEYEPGNEACRDQVLAAVDALSVLSLPRANGDATIDMADEDNRFVRSLVGMAGRRALQRIILPPQARAVLAIAGALPYIGRGLRSLGRGRLAVDVLDATAISVSLIQRQFDSAASVMFLLKISDALQQHVNARTRIALEESLLTRAETVWAVDGDGCDYEVHLSDVHEGMHLRVRTGQTFPVDGTVLEGEAEVNEASMTGEAAEVHKHEGATVFAGTVMSQGNLVIRVDALPGSSRIDQIVQLVEDSSENKAGVQSRAENLADALVPASLGVFAGTLGLTRNLYKASSALMVDYSCAIKLSTPVAVMSAMREASADGAVVKGGKYLEALANADVIVFDKTGTLTTAEPKVEKVIPFGKMNEDEVLKNAACLEEHFPHSIARAIVQAAKDRGLHHENENHAEVDYLVAHGIASKIGRRKVLLGSAHFIFDDEGIAEPKGLHKQLEKEAPTSSTVFMAVGGRLEAVICISDPLRPEARDVLAQLRALGVSHHVMLTGDSQICAAHVAQELGIDEFHAQVLPEDKSWFVEELKAAGHTVIMVGDGINDSPALAAANVSVALNDASDIARAVADVSVMGSSLESLLVLRRLSRSLMTRINTDYRFIVGFNTALIALGLVGVLPPTAAAYAHNISTVAITAANTRPLLPETRANRALPIPGGVSNGSS